MDTTAAGISAQQITDLALHNDSDGIIALVRALPEEERRSAARLVQRTLSSRARTSADLDLYVAVMRPLIDRGIADAGVEAAGLDDEADRIKDHYNALSYNFAADLADCWPGDAATRERSHFEAGLAAAEDCIRWRNELGKPPRSFSIAYWAKGMHLLSLGHYGGAVKSFELAQGFARRHAEETGLPADSFDIVLNGGYLGLAEALLGEGEGLASYDAACAAFRATAAAGGDDADDAKFGLQQLEHVRGKYLPAG